MSDEGLDLGISSEEQVDNNPEVGSDPWVTRDDGSESFALSLENVEIVKQYGGADGLVNALKEAEKKYEHLRSHTSKRVEEYSKENWEAFAASREGFADIPASHEGYDHPNWVFGQVKEESDVVKAEWQKLCKANGLTRTQANGIYEGLANSNALAARQAEEARSNFVKNSVSSLKKDWGEAYESKVNSVRHYLHNIAPNITGASAEESLEFLESSGLSNHPWLLKQFAVWGDAGGGAASRGYAGGTPLAPCDAAAELDFMSNDPEARAILCNRNHPLYSQYRSQFSNLIKTKNGRA